MLFVLLFLSNAKAEDSDSAAFTRYSIPSGWSFDLPASWKVDTESSRDISEFYQAKADYNIKDLTGQNAGAIKTYMVASKEMFNDTCLVTISTHKYNGVYSQDTLLKLSHDEIQKLCEYLTTQLACQTIKDGSDPKTVVNVYVSKFNGKAATVATVDVPHGIKSYEIEVPAIRSNEALKFQFVCKDATLWITFIQKIIGSVNFPN